MRRAILSMFALLMWTLLVAETWAAPAEKMGSLRINMEGSGWSPQPIRK